MRHGRAHCRASSHGSNGLSGDRHQCQLLLRRRRSGTARRLEDILLVLLGLALQASSASACSASRLVQLQAQVADKLTAVVLVHRDELARAGGRV